MSVAELTPEQVKELAKYLDQFPAVSPQRDAYGDEVSPDQYWRQLVEALGRLPKAAGRVRYSVEEVEEFAMEELVNRSPSRRLLMDLQRRKKPASLETFISCLDEIACKGAQNVFITGTCPEFTSHPVPLAVHGGGHIVLTCEAKCDPPSPTFLWFHGDRAIPNSSSKRLEIKNANVIHSGEYRCRATNPHINDPNLSSEFSHSVQVRVSDTEFQYTNTPIRQEVGERPPPYITRQPEPSKKVEVGKKLELVCEAVGDGLQCQWYRNRKELPGQCSGQLEVWRVRVEDKGEYYCRVQCDGRSVESTHTTVSVVVAVEITEHPQDCEGRVGEEVTVSCRARGPEGKELVYTWFLGRPGKLLPVCEGQEYTVELKYTPRKEYKVYCKVSLAGDPEHMATSKTATLNLHTVWFTRQPESVARCVGDQTSLFCSAESVIGKKVTYLWFTVDSGKKTLVKTCEHGVLTFPSLSQADWGQYVCQAQNELEFITSNKVKVTVHLPGSDSREVQPPLIRFLKQPWSWVVNEGQRFRLLCQAVCSNGKPVQYQWFFNGRLLERETGAEFIRQETRADDYGYYFCEVISQDRLARELSNVAWVVRGLSGDQAVGRSGSQLAQWKAERFLRRCDKSRYAVEKVALLIGNQRYESIQQLTNPERDILELEKLLRKLNFKVFSMINLRFTEMLSALDIFYEMIAVPGAYALFYYSGHGFSHNRTTYLMPVDASRPFKCDYSIVSDNISARMQEKLSRNFKILDCCRVTEEDIIEPSKPLNRSNFNYSNLYEIHSCPESHMAYDSKDEPISSFNMAVREAIQQKPRGMANTYQLLLDSMRQAGVGEDGHAHQRPWNSSSMADGEISLHDEIMRDAFSDEAKLDEVCSKWERANALPEAVTLTPEDLGELTAVLSAQLTFSADYTNVLLVNVELTLQRSCTAASVDFDQEFMGRQGVEVEVLTRDVTENDAGVTSNRRNTKVRVMHIQRLKPQTHLTLTFTIRATVHGGERRVQVARKLHEKPLIASLWPTD